MTHAEHKAADAVTRNEAEHGGWLDARIARGLDIALGVPVTLFAGPALPGDGLDWRRGEVAGRIAALSPFSLDRNYDAAASKAKGWVRVVNGGGTGWLRRDELLSSIAVNAGSPGRPARTRH